MFKQHSLVIIVAAIFIAISISMWPEEQMTHAQERAGRSELKWEHLIDKFEGQNLLMRTSRARVPGGWLVAVFKSGVTFVPDPNHAWK